MLRGARSMTLMLTLLTSFALSCTDLKTSEPGADPGDVDPGEDASSGTDGRSADLPDGEATDGGRPVNSDASVGPAAACRKTVLDCLDKAPANVIEVPTEMSLADAFAAAKANDVVQVRGATLGGGWAIPAYVTLRGCAGAKIAAGIRFAGSGGIVEGFEVAGTLVANATGSYVVRQNRFTSGGAANEPGVSGRSVDALVSAAVTLIVDANVFEGRTRGVEAATSYDTMTHAVDISVRNNVFVHVEEPVRVSEGGLVGVINAKIEHNTFFDFGTAISLFSVDRKTTTSGNLFVSGEKAISGSTYEVHHSLASDVTMPAGTPPLAGTFAAGDPKLVDANAGDVRLGPGSAALDQIPNGYPVPAEDHQGCPRPAGGSGALPQGDIGAFESQP